MRRWGAGLATLLVAGAVAGGVVISGDQGSGGGLACDQSVSTRAAVLTALTSSGNAGQTICVTAPITGSSISTSTDMASEMRLVAQPRDGTVDMVSLACSGCSNITVDGFEFTGEQGIGVGGSTASFHVVKNTCHDQQTNCVQLGTSGGPHSDFWAVGNTITGVEYPSPGVFGRGYGIFADVAMTDAKFNFNYCGPSGPMGSADCMEIGQTDGGEFVGNIFVEQLDRGSDSHADAFMSWNGSNDILVQDNRVYDSHNILLSPDGDNYTVANNLFVQMDNRCVDNSSNGSSGEVHPQGWTITNNTIYDCDVGGWDMDIDAPSARGGNVFNDNLIQGISCGDFSAGNIFGTGNVDADGNVFTGGAVNCGFSTGTNTTWTASFTDATTNGDYVPNSLPTGYEDAGYRAAPAGPDDCPESACGEG